MDFPGGVESRCRMIAYSSLDSVFQIAYSVGVTTAIAAGIPLVLADELRTIVGTDGVLANPSELRVCERDAYTLEKSLPNIVVLPRTTTEHDIGVEKIDFIEKQFTKNDLDAMRAMRRVLNPENRCNPHEVFPGSKRCSDFTPAKQIAA